MGQTMSKLNLPGNWRVWVLLAFACVIAFTWLNEIWDLPHLLLGAPATPVNWRESIIETVFSIVMLAICWTLIRRYEVRWLDTV
ncbi:MAG: hypothetical protein AB1649_29120, partial [Chloroflexota bacterium]